MNHADFARSVRRMLGLLAAWAALLSEVAGVSRRREVISGAPFASGS